MVPAQWDSDGRVRCVTVRVDPVGYNTGGLTQWDGPSHMGAMYTYGEAGTALARPPASSRRRCLNAAMRLPPRLLFPFAPTHCQNLCQARILPCFYKSIQVSNDGGATWSRISATVLLPVTRP